jgi:CDP-paratose 2-epimerase
MHLRILITGGLGFIGTSLCHFLLKKNFTITVFDNISRRGSEYGLPLLLKKNIQFVHGDVRNASDFELLGAHDVVIDASANPSVLSGISDSVQKNMETHLQGTLNVCEYCRKHQARLIFLSTSRVYSVDSLKSIPLTPNKTKTSFILSQPSELGAGTGTGPDAAAAWPKGLSQSGIDENFSTEGRKSFYGAGKFAAETLVQEYSHYYKFPSVINRLGVVAGEGQWGKSEQGVFAYWLMAYAFKQSLNFQGHGGQGLQVRDLLHPQDLCRLLAQQIQSPLTHLSEVFNVGGGTEGTTSLFEWDERCKQRFDAAKIIRSVEKTHVWDIPYYVSNNQKISERFQWRPEHSLANIFSDIAAWIGKSERVLKEYLNILED